jgi:hypothetical protein
MAGDPPAGLKFPARPPAGVDPSIMHIVPIPVDTAFYDPQVRRCGRGVKG